MKTPASGSHTGENSREWQPFAGLLTERISHLHLA